jgi:type I restriction enzyme S subunit
MSNLWKEIFLKEICSDISYGYTASASDKVLGIKFLRITDIVNKPIKWNQVPSCVITDKDIEKYKLSKGDILIARTGATTGYNYTFNSHYPSVFASYLIRYKIVPELADPFFIGYNLQSDNWKGFVENIIGGSAQPGANAQQFASYQLLLPPLPEQQAIAEVLSCLDDKIDLLHRNNKTLEEMAETLFRQWFVEGAKEEWEKINFGDVVTVKRGGSPRPIQDFLSDTGLRWLKISDVTGIASPYIFEIKEHIIDSGLNKTVFLKSGSLVVSNSATPGIPKILCVDSCIHDGWLYFPKSKLSNEFLYLFFLKIKDELVSLGNGSIFTNLKTDIVKSFPLSLPDESTLIEFDSCVKPLFEKMLNNTTHINSLVQIRDTLLPKLMSGQVRVKIDK